jgi:Ca-activated chloride channel family protein
MKRNRLAGIAIALLLAAGLAFPAGCASRAPAATGGNAYSQGAQEHRNSQAQQAPLPAATAAASAEPPAYDENGSPMADGSKGESLSAEGGYRYNRHYEPDTSGEEYNDVDEIGFRSPVRWPLSTFSADPDSAAYSNIRRMILDGSRIPTDAVRIEEMINYFHYDYPQPKGGEPFSVSTEYARCPWNEDHDLLLIGIQGMDVQKEDLPPSNLVFLLDVSGSMADDDKLPLVQRSFLMLTNRLTSRDTVSIVTYASGVHTILEGVNGSKKARIMDAIEDLEAGGSTAGASGLQTAYEVARDYFIEGGNNRVILATDGDFNVGPSSDEEMVQLISGKRKTGVFLSVMGFGMGNLKDAKMESMAQNGNGNYAYIDGIQEARKVMVHELGGTLLTIAKDVKLQVEFNPAEVKGYRLIGYENNMLADEDFNNDRVDAGEIGAGHQVTALYEIIPADSKEDVSGSTLKYQATEFTSGGELCTVSIRYKDPEESKSRLISLPVKRSIFTKEPSDNFLFASAVAEFGLLLRDSRYMGDASWRSLITRADLSADDDLKEEFIELAERARRND